jgi:hypothetical protein
MCFGVRRRGHTLGLFFSLLSLVAPAIAAEGGVSVRVDCPALGEEQRAALESRAKTELLVRRESGSLAVTCGAGAVDVRWQPETGAARERQIAFAPDASATQDQVLEALELLLGAAPGPAPAASAPPAVTPPATPPVPPPPPKPPAPAPLPVARPLPEPPARNAEAPFVEVLAGVALELWSSEAAAVLGPEARATLALPAGWAVSGGVLVAWTLRAPEDVGGRLVRGRLGGEYHPDSARRFRFGAALLLDWLTATRDSAASSETRHDVGLAGLLGARYLLLAPPVRLALGPDLSIRGAPVRVVIGDSEIFRIPTLAVGASAELVLGPL